jgi:hypothetical protein
MVPQMLPSHIEDFARGCLADNRMAVRETARDQVEFYTLTPGDRSTYRTRKVDLNVQRQDFALSEKETDF